MSLEMISSCLKLNRISYKLKFWCSMKWLRISNIPHDHIFGHFSFGGCKFGFSSANLKLREEKHLNMGLLILFANGLNCATDYSVLVNSGAKLGRPYSFSYKKKMKMDHQNRSHTHVISSYLLQGFQCCYWNWVTGSRNIN